MTENRRAEALGGRSSALPQITQACLRLFSPIDVSRLDLPVAGTTSVPIFGRDAAERAVAVEAFCEKYVLPLSEARDRQASSGLTRAHADPALCHNAVQYGKFVEMLSSRGIVELMPSAGTT